MQNAEVEERKHQQGGYSASRQEMILSTLHREAADKEEGECESLG